MRRAVSKSRHRAHTASLVALGGAALAACAPAVPGSAAQEPTPPTAESAGYAAPPTLLTASRSGQDVALAGRAAVGARVHIASPDGWNLVSLAGRDGLWRARLPQAAVPRMYALSAEAGGRRVRAEGALVTLPAPAPAALLVRAGYAVLSLPARPARPSIVAVDFDAVGSAAVGGVAAPNTRVQLAVDGQPADVDLTDAGGRFALVGPRNRPLPPGGHRFAVTSAPGAADSASIALSPARPLTSPFQASRAPEGWRLDWAVPGGGVQSTLVLDKAGSAS